MSHRREGPASRMGYSLLRLLTRNSYRRPWTVLVVALCLCLLSLLYAGQKLDLQADLSALLAPSDRYRTLETAARAEFPGQDLVVVVARGTVAQREEFIDALSLRLKARPSLYLDVFAKMDLNFFRSRLLYYLSGADLRALADTLQPSVNWMARPTLDPISEGSPRTQVLLTVVERMARDYRQTLDSRGDTPYVSLWKSALLEKAPTPLLKQRLQQMLDPGQYLYNAWPESDIHLVFVRPAGPVRSALQNLQQEIDRLTTGYSVLEVGITGEPAIALNEIDEAVNAAWRAALLSCLLLALLFRVSFANSWRPWIMTATLLLGLSWTVGFATLTVGSLNLLSLTACPVVVALGAGFGIQVLYGYEDQRAKVASPLAAMERCLEQAGMHTLAAALLAAAGFAAVALTGYQALTDFAIIGCGGVLLCLLSVVSVLPAWLFLQERYGKRTLYRPHWTRWLKSHEAIWLERPRLTVLLSALLTVVCLPLAGSLQFDHNLLHLQAQDLRMSRVENRLLARQQDVLPAEYMAPTVDDARRKSELFARLSTVARVDSPALLLPLEAQSKSTEVKRIVSLAGKLRVPILPALNAQVLQTSMIEVRIRLQRLRGWPAALSLLGVLNYAEQMAIEAGPGPVVDSVNLYLANLRKDLTAGLFLLQQQTASPVTIDQLPLSLRLRSVGKTGKILVQIYARESPWDYGARQKFWAQLQTVDPDVTGVPVVLQHQTWILINAFQRSAWFAGVVMVVLLLLYFDGLWKTLLVMLPQAVGLIWLSGAMAVCGVSFNLVNFTALPMLLAVGGVLGIHFVQRLTHDSAGGILNHPMGAAMSVSGLASMAVFASLMSARHNGIASLGFVLTVGLAANMVSTLVFMPALTRWLARQGITF